MGTSKRKRERERGKNVVLCFCFGRKDKQPFQQVESEFNEDFSQQQLSIRTSRAILLRCTKNTVPQQQKQEVCTKKKQREKEVSTTYPRVAKKRKVWLKERACTDVCLLRHLQPENKPMIALSFFVSLRVVRNGKD